MHLNMKLKRKQTLLGILKAIAYFAGYPLMVLYIAMGSVPYMTSSAYGGTWYLGIVIALIPWAVSAVLQIVFGFITQNQYLKTLVVGIVSVVCILGCAVGIDIKGEQMLKDVNEKYAATTVVNEDGTTSVVTPTITLPTYRRAQDGTVDKITWTISSTSISFQTLDYLKGYHLGIKLRSGGTATSYASNLNQFMEVYNVSLGGSSGTTNYDLSTATIDSETGIPFNPNGLVSDGYTYSVDFAMNVLINYYEAVNKFAKVGVNMKDFTRQGDDESDEDYKARVKALNAMSAAEKLDYVYKYDLAKVKESDEYKAYQTSDEYVAAYGEDGSAYGFMLTVDRVKEIVPVLVRYIDYILCHTEVLASLADPELGLLENFVGWSHLVETLENKNYTIADIRNWFLSYVVDGLKGFIDEDLLLSIADMITEENLENLLTEYVYYNSPSVRTAFDFFGEAKEGENYIGTHAKAGVGEEDAFVFTAEDMRAYAYARYYAKTNGAVIGSVLISNNDEGLGKLLNADGNIGQVTMTSSGYPASFGYSLGSIYQLKADKEYAGTLYPLLTARRFLYIFAGLVFISIVLYYQFARRENEVIASILVDQMKGGADNE